MFYLTKRVDEKQCTPGERCMVLADFSGIPAGTKGTVLEVYDAGLWIEWDGAEEREDWLGTDNPRSFGKRRDGFGRDELEYLAFETLKHPKVDPKVNTKLINLALTEKEEKVIKMRKQGWTLEVVGKELGITRERVRQIEAKAKEKLRMQKSI